MKFIYPHIRKATAVRTWIHPHAYNRNIEPLNKLLNLSVGVNRIFNPREARNGQSHTRKDVGVYAILIFFSSIIIQISFVSILDFLPFMPNIFLAVLFALSYFLSLERFLLMATIGCLIVDLLGSMSIGSTVIALYGAFALSFFLKASMLKKKKGLEFLINGLITFHVFYFLLIVTDNLFKNSAILDNLAEIININLFMEILFNSFIGLLIFYILMRFKENKLSPRRIALKPSFKMRHLFKFLNDKLYASRQSSSKTIKISS